MAPVNLKGECLIGITGNHFDHGTGFDAKAVEIFEQAAVALEDADDSSLAGGWQFVKGDEAAVVSILFRLEAQREAVGTVFFVA